MKGQQQAVTAVLIVGVLVSVVVSVYFWGVPIIEKNQARYQIERAEALMKNINTKIREVANNGGRERIKIDVPGIMYFDDKEITFEIESGARVYPENITLISGATCDSSIPLSWEDNSPESLCAESVKMGENKYRTIFYLSYRKLYIENQDGTIEREYEIDLQGSRASGGLDHEFVVELAEITGNKLIKASVDIRII